MSAPIPFPGLSKQRVLHLIDRAVKTVAWADLTGKPSTFPPSAHNHAAGDITSGVLSAARLPAGIYQDKSIVRSNSRTGTFSMAGYDAGLGSTLVTGSTVITTADGYDPAKAYWVEMSAEMYVTITSGVVASLAVKRQDLLGLGLSGFADSRTGYADEQRLTMTHVFLLPAGGLPGQNGVAANTLDCRIHLRFIGSTAPTARDGGTAVRMTPA